MSKLAKQKIAVLKGGPGSEREVSLASGAGVGSALQQLGADVLEIDVRGPDFMVPQDVLIAFNAIHGTFGEDGELQEILDARNILYTGEGVAGSRIAFDKIKSKQRFVERSVPTAGFETITTGGRPSMSIPYVIKAPRQGSSVGVYIVKSPDEVDTALSDAAKYDEVLLIEKFVKGRELTVGILGDQALPVIEICPHSGFYDFKNKYPFLNAGAISGARHLCPAPLNDAETRLIQETALAAHQALDLEVYSRVDLLLSDSGEVSVLEINTIPGMTQASLLPEAAGVAGISFSQLCERIIDLSMARQKRK